LLSGQMTEKWRNTLRCSIVLARTGARLIAYY